MLNNYKISRNIVIREELFGGLVFDRINFVIYRLTPKAYLLLSSFYVPYKERCEVCDRLSINDDELKSFLEHSLRLNFLVEKDKNEDILPSTKCEYTNSLRLTKADISGCKSTDTLITTLRAPTFVWWDITYTCNFSCTYCYSNSGKKSEDELDFADVCRILDMLHEAGVFYIFFLGGEPLMRKDFFKILEYAQTIGLSTMLTSNGWFIDDSVANKLHDAGVSIARISIDGYNSYTHDKIRNKEGSWQKATAAVRNLLSAQIPRVGISPTVTAENLEELSDLIEWAYENNVNEIQISPLCATGRGSQLPELSIEQSVGLKNIVRKAKEQYKMEINAPEGIDDESIAQSCVRNHSVAPLLSGCGAGRNSISLSPSGEVFPCILKREFLGNILDYEKLSDLLQSEPLLNLRKKRASCLGCKYEDYCAGLCRLMETRGSLDCRVIDSK